MNGTTLPDRLRMAREMAGLSAIGLSKLAGLPSGAHVGLIESGRRPNPTVETLGPIAKALGISTDWLIYGDGEVPTSEAVRAAVSASGVNADPSGGPDDTGTFRVGGCEKADEPTWSEG